MYRRVLSLGAAAIVAAWLPFSVMYIDAVNKQATPVAAITAPHSSGGATRLVTTASGATRVVPASSPTSPTAIAGPSSVTTNAS